MLTVFNIFGNISADPGSPAIKFSKLVLFMRIYLQTKIKKSKKGPIFFDNN
jgi:hypothetical protein